MKIVYRNEEIVFVASNHQINGDGYENLGLSHLRDEL